MAKIKLKRLNSSSSDDSFNDRKVNKDRKKRNFIQKMFNNSTAFYLPSSKYHEIVDCSYEKRISINSLMEENKTLKKTLSDYKTNNQLMAKENEKLKQLNRHYQNEINKLKINLINLDHEKSLLDEYKKKVNEQLKVLVVNNDAKSTTLKDDEQISNGDTEIVSVQATKHTTGRLSRLVKTNSIRKYLNKRDQFLKAVDEFEEPIQETSLNESVTFEVICDYDDDRGNFIDFVDSSNQNYEQQQQQQIKLDVENSKSKNLRSPLSTLVNKPFIDRSPLITTFDKLDTDDDNEWSNAEKENHLKRRRAPVSYKEPNLKCKVRRDKLNHTIYVSKPNSNPNN